MSVASCTSSAVSLCPVKKGEKSRIDIKYCEEEEEEEEFLPRSFFPHHRPFASHATKKKERNKKGKKRKGGDRARFEFAMRNMWESIEDS